FKMESALCTLLSALVVLLCSSPECKGEDTVTQTQGDASVPQGHTATIQCSFQRNSGFSYYLFWYSQNFEFNKPKYDTELKETSFSLKIQDVDVTDSAVYYCALPDYYSQSLLHLDRLTARPL
uniref:Ig-like domain-containing protein n=1 Tax=Periophthalmus magnuspinnatus TaxID=409849 RepID=A0A3B4B4N9_9GOBI